MILIENLPILQEVNITKWHEKGYKGKGVTIALLDSKGIPREHMKDYYVDVLGTQTEIGHATNVGFTAHQFAPEARILMFSGTHDSDEAFEYIEAHKDEIDLINVSLAGIGGSTTPSYLRYEALGIPMLCASGNDDFEDQISYPARYDFTIAIGAYNWRSDYVEGYSNEGEGLDAVAPSGIYMMRDDGYTFSVNGTSFASPSATGMLACYIQWRNENGLPKLKPEEARSFIHQNGKDIEELGYDIASGHGLFVMPDVPAPLPKPEPPKPPATTTYYRVVTGSFGSRENADARIEALKADGFSSFILIETINGKTMYRVITGSFLARENAEARKAELQSSGFSSFIAIYIK